MADKYSDNLHSSRAIYPSRFVPYIILLVVSKFFRAFGIYLSYDILKLIHVVQFLFIIKAGSSLFLIFLQKPFSSGKRITKHQWFRIGRHAFFGSIIQLLWLFGLTLCGPLRTILIFEHHNLVIIAGASALFTNGGSPSKMRGAVFFLLAVMGILLFDHDDVKADMHHDDTEVHRHSSIISHLFSHITNWTGLSDHKGGVVLLFITLCFHVGYDTAAKKLSVDVGGSKRLNALSTLVSTLLILPWAGMITFTSISGIESWVSMIFPMFLVIVFVFVSDYYIEAVCVNRIEVTRTSRFGAMAIFINGMILSCIWAHPFVMRITNLQHVKDIVTEDHVLSGGVVFSFVLFMFSTQILTSATKSSKGSLVGYSSAGLPLYNFAGEALHRTSQSVLTISKNVLRQILEESDSRKIFYFLCINLSFTFVELTYGVWTNSLGLISDGFHMLFDCSALVMGLYAAVMSRWKATRIYSYGYDRVEILSGFVNGLFLIVIGFFIFTAAMARIFDPPEIHTEKLLTVSVAGLLVNLIGILAFSHGHSHGVGGSHSHGGSKAQGGDTSHAAHGHSHGAHGNNHGHSHSHGHSHGGGAKAAPPPPSLAHNTNMQGVFLHVLADTLGSVGVIISTLLIEAFGLHIADPICSIFIAVMVFLSVIPLVQETSSMLLLQSPEQLQETLIVALPKVLATEGVISFRDEHFWTHSSTVVCGTIHLQVTPTASEQKVIAQVTSIFKEVGVNNLTIQVEKETYFHHMSGLGVSMDQVIEMTKNFKALNHENTANFIKAI